ncbi:hypothetical protein [Aquabacterium sp.]|uniref:hypothetical protein n=1 Tax=Aquabacterium sp. TaxID=1872578 RepID=UPI0037851405
MKLKFCYLSGGHHPIAGDILYPVQLISDGPEAERYQRYLASPLGSAARDPQACDRLSDAIARVKSGELEEYLFDADDVELSIRRDFIQCDIVVNNDWVGNPAGRIGLQLWQLALDGWRKFLDMPKSIESTVEIELPEESA